MRLNRLRKRQQPFMQPVARACSTGDRKCLSRFYTLFALTLLSINVAAQAQTDLIFTEHSEEWIEGDFDLHDQDSLRDLTTETSPFAFRHQLSFTKSGSGFETERLVDYDNVKTAEMSYSLVGLYKASDQWEFYTGFEFNVENTDDGERENSLSIDALYALRKFASNGSYLGIGRQEIEDDRSWMISESVDGVSYVMESGLFAVTGFIGSQNQTLENILATDEESDDLTNPHDHIAYGRVYGSLGVDKQASAYIAYFSDKEQSTGENNLYLGFRSLGNFSDNGSYWVEAAMLSGTSESRDVRAHAFDAGITYTWNDVAFKPGYTLGFAYGSGDDGTGTDSRFRQSGLHANEAAHRGVVDLKYYGQVLDPQLSNLQILTLGLGIRPKERFSVDLLLNSYWQDHPSTEIMADGIEFSANGTDHYIGSGLDLVIGLRSWSQLSISLVYGRFEGADDISADVGSIEFLWNL